MFEDPAIREKKLKVYKEEKKKMEKKNQSK